MKGKQITLYTIIMVFIAIMIGIGFSCTTPVDGSGGGSSGGGGGGGTSLTVTINQDGGQSDPVNTGSINFAVVFSEAVTDFVTGDVTLSGTAGGTLTGTVTGSGATYNVEVAGMTTNGTVIATIAAGVAHNAANTANLASTSADNTVTWDVTAPDVALSSLAPEPAIAPFDITITFSEAIDPATFTAGDITFTAGAGSASTPATSNNITWTSTITPTSPKGTIISVNVNASAVQDPAGNNNNAAPAPITRTWAPLFGVSLSCSAPDPANAPYEITITFTEEINQLTFDETDITFTAGTGSASVPATSDNRIYTSTISPTSQGTVTVTINAAAVQNLSAEDNLAASTPITRIWDNIAPDVALSCTAPEPTILPFEITITFTEAIDPATFTSGDINFTSGTGNASTPATSDNITWTSTITPTSEGTITVTMDAAAVQDPAGNDNTAAPTPVTRTYDLIPGVSLSCSAPNPANAAYNVTITFTEAINPATFDETDITFTAGTGSASTPATGDNITWTTTITPASQGNVTVTINAGAIQDPTGNNNTASTNSITRVWDTTSPDVALSSSAPEPARTPFVITITFSEAIDPATFTAGDINFTAGTGSASAPSTSDNITWTSIITPTVEGAVTVTVYAAAVLDPAGNDNTAAPAPVTRTWDPVPGVSLSSSAPGVNNTPYNITITFTETINPSTFDDTDIAFTAGTGTATAPTTGDNITWTSTITPSSQGTITVTIFGGVAEDATGNLNTASTNSITRTWDTVSPDVSLSCSAPDPTNTPYGITIMFSEAIDPATFTAGDITFTTGTGSASAPSTSDNITWSSTITPTSIGTVTVTVNAAVVQDPTGNDNTAAPTPITRTWDAAPGVSLSCSAPNPTNTAYDITIIFTEAINPVTFSETDISFTAGTGSASAPTSGDNITWTSTITPTSQGTITVTINAGAAEDTTGNNNTASTNSITRTWDTVGPDVSLSSSAPNPIGAPYSITITFNEAINPATFTAGDISFTAGTGSAGAPSTSDNITWLSTITPASQGSVTVTINSSRVTDAAGNDNNAASSSITRTWDSVGPDVALSSSVPDPTNTPYSITITFSEAIDPATFTAGDIDFTAGTGSASAPSTSDNITWTSTITPTSQGTVTVTVNANAAQDLAGNDCTAAPTPITTTWDTQGPTVALTSSAANPISTPYSITITFSEAIDPATFTAGDISFTTGTGSASAPSSGDNIIWTSTITPTSQGTVTVTVNANAVQDPLGYNNTAAPTPVTRTWDTIQPDVALSSSAPNPINVPYSITITFSEEINPATFTAGDISFTAGTGSAGAPSTSDNISFISTITPTSQGTVTVTVNANAAQDLAGNDSTAAPTPITRTWDTLGPTVALTSAAPNPTNTPYSITITFNEAIDPSTFTAGDISFTAGTGSASAPSTSDNIIWTSTITPTSQGTVTVTVNAAAVQDPTGNDNSAAPTPITRIWDTVAPNVTSITSTTSATTGAYPIPVTIVFNEAVNPSSFTTADIAVTGTGVSVQGGSLTSGDNITWTVNILTTAASAGAISVTVNAGVCADAAGNTNTNTGTVTLNRTYVTTIPYRNFITARNTTATVTTGALNLQGGTFVLIQVVWEATTNITINATYPRYQTTEATPITGSDFQYTNGTNYWLKMQSFYVQGTLNNNQTVSVQFSAAPTEAKITGISYQNVDSVSPFVQVVTSDKGATAAAYALTTNITPTSYWSLLNDLYAGSNNSTSVAQAGSTKTWSADTNNAIGGSGRKQLTAAPALTTMGFTITSAQATRLIHEIIELRIVQ